MAVKDIRQKESEKANPEESFFSRGIFDEMPKGLYPMIGVGKQADKPARRKHLNKGIMPKWRQQINPCHRPPVVRVGGKKSFPENRRR